MSDEQLYALDKPPSELIREALDGHRYTRIGGGDPGELATFVANWLDNNDYVLRSRVETQHVRRPAVVWPSASVRSGARFVVHADGRAVMYDNAGTVVFDSAARGTGAP